MSWAWPLATFHFFYAELTTGRLLKSQCAENRLLHFLREKGTRPHRIKVWVKALEKEQLSE